MDFNELNNERVEWGATWRDVYVRKVDKFRLHFGGIKFCGPLGTEQKKSRDLVVSFGTANLSLFISVLVRCGNGIDTWH